MNADKSVTAHFTKQRDTIPPSAPETFEVLSLGQTYAQVSWSESQDNGFISMYTMYVNGEYGGMEVA